MEQNKPNSQPTGKPEWLRGLADSVKAERVKDAQEMCEATGINIFARAYGNLEPIDADDLAALALVIACAAKGERAAEYLTKAATDALAVAISNNGHLMEAKLDAPQILRVLSRYE